MLFEKRFFHEIIFLPQQDVNNFWHFSVRIEEVGNLEVSLTFFMCSWLGRSKKSTFDLKPQLKSVTSCLGSCWDKNDFAIPELKNNGMD